MILIKVDLPEPDWPVTMILSLFLIVRLILSQIFFIIIEKTYIF